MLMDMLIGVLDDHHCRTHSVTWRFWPPYKCPTTSWKWSAPRRSASSRNWSHSTSARTLSPVQSPSGWASSHSPTTSRSPTTLPWLDPSQPSFATSKAFAASSSSTPACPPSSRGSATVPLSQSSWSSTTKSPEACPPSLVSSRSCKGSLWVGTWCQALCLLPSVTFPISPNSTSPTTSSPAPFPQTTVPLWSRTCQPTSVVTSSQVCGFIYLFIGLLIYFFIGLGWGQDKSLKQAFLS